MEETMAAIFQGARYAFRFLRSKVDAFRAFGSAGLEAGRLPHSVVRPIATYSPWRADGEFQKVYRAIHRNTLVDVYRCYDLWQLTAESRKLTSGNIIEVGVWRGGTGCLIARQAQTAMIPATVYLCDTFRGVVKTGSSDRHYQGGEHSDTSASHVLELAGGLGLSNVRILEGIFPDETGHQVADVSFRLCHIDVDVYESGRDILAWLWPRVVPGGMVIFDDYGFLSTGGITKLVNEERQRGDRLTLHNLNGHAVLVKLM
jgi:O-methyltransferase